jgi:hypothetical protein
LNATTIAVTLAIAIGQSDVALVTLVFTLFCRRDTIDGAAQPKLYQQ